MTGRLALLLGTSLVASFLFLARAMCRYRIGRRPDCADSRTGDYPAQPEAYKLALKEQIETSIRVEPGVLRCMPFRSRSILNRSDCLKPIRMQLPTNRTCRVRISKHTKIGRGRW